ncbi:MAG: General secretion pathway protein G [uncultured Sulfurovum sp.]|uniref:Type II secretion system core protein G n=1 Tax=uncultured Sulfurovum sp. TaxID=269237 RepID=A0A6S6TG83_9BACT|nr:MAG: General secretion pathway protein G [uncultured Sulfurovum sp.]
MKKNNFKKAFTIIELMVVITIIGILASLVAPKFMGKLESAKIKTTKAQLEMFSTALDSFNLDTGRYPTESEGLSVLWIRNKDIKGYDGPYLPKAVDADAWGNAYVYKQTSDHHAFDILSYGKDGKEGGDAKDADISLWEN